MTQQDKELLLQDLCGRLPYGVKCEIRYGQDVLIGKLNSIDVFGRVNIDGHIKDVCDIKPFLFPLSSMTEEQSEELEEINPGFYSRIGNNGNIHLCMNARGCDWLNKCHFDWRGLIPKGLAKDAVKFKCLAIY